MKSLNKDSWIYHLQSRSYFHMMIYQLNHSRWFKHSTRFLNIFRFIWITIEIIAQILTLSIIVMFILFALKIMLSLIIFWQNNSLKRGFLFLFSIAQMRIQWKYQVSIQTNMLKCESFFYFIIFKLTFFLTYEYSSHHRHCGIT